MALTYNLPKLSNEDFPDAPAAGVWVKSGRLDDMSAALTTAVDEVGIDTLKSLPDPWARPLLFNQALTTAGHIAGGDARKQWRGLLALLALRHFYGNSYILGLQTIDLRDNNVGNPRFRAVLRRLAPIDSLLPGLDWMRTGVLTIRTAGEDRFSAGEARAIGLLVPNCLVAPARGTSKLVMPGVPWMNDGLSDPCDCADIPGDQWVALREYLGNIFDRLQGADIAFTAEPFRNELRLFAQECQKHIQSSGASTYTPQMKGFSETLPHPFYDVVASAPMPSEELTGPISECEIRLNLANGILNRPNQTDQSKLAGVILIDPDIATRTLKKRPQDVRLYNNYALGTINQGNLAAMTRDAERDGYLVITPDHLLTDKLVSLVNEGRVGTHGPKWERFLLPISPLALFLIDRNKIISRLSIDDQGDKIEVSLTLDLMPSGAQDKSPSHTIVRHYNKQTQVIQESVPDDIILWPDVGLENWPWNFMRYSFNSEYEMAPRFAASMRSLADTIALRARNNRDEGIALLKSLGSKDDLVFERMDTFFQGNLGELKAADGSLISHRFRFTDIEDAVGEQHILGQGADYLFFATKPENGTDLEPAGCMLLPERRVAQGQGSMEIAVDFGTTNTVVYLRSADQTERMVFQPRVSRPITGRLAEADQFAFDCVEFFPANEVASPFPTVMHRRSFDLRGTTALQSASNSEYHGITDNIFFMPEVNDKFGFAVERQEKKQLAFDLKWSADAEVKRMVKRFLRQIILMSTVEAMSREITPARLKWHFSYPQAWSRTQSGVFQTAVKQAWQEIMRPVLGRTVRPEDFIDFETEGAAALRYFIDGPEHAGQAGRLILMFDIGGGTTEIAVYHREQTIWRSSFRLAGGDFFTRFLSHNITVFDQFRDSGSSIQDVLQKFGKDLSMKHFVELYISQPGFNESFAESYPMFSEEPEGVGLTNSALVGLAGLFYYTGLVLRNLMQRGLVNERDIETLTIAFAGRGSSFFQYLGDAGDEMAPLGQLARMITDVVHAKVEGHDQDAASSWTFTDPRLRSRFSTHPKHEVAHGMLCGEPNTRHRRALNAETPLGEHVDVVDNATHKLASTDFVETIPPGSQLSAVGEKEFNRFLDLLAARTGLRVKLDSKGGNAREEINNIVDREFSRALGALERAADDEAGETLDIEPPFITKLRALVHILARNIEERQNLLVVQNGEPR